MNGNPVELHLLQNHRIFLCLSDDHAMFLVFHACTKCKASLLWHNKCTGIPLVFPDHAHDIPHNAMRFFCFRDSRKIRLISAGFAVSQQVHAGKPGFHIACI